MSLLSLVEHYAPEVELFLHTPAHQGRSVPGSALPAEAWRLDRPYITPDRLEHLERESSNLFGAGGTFYLTGGTSQGMLAACLLLSRRGASRVAVGRNCHVSFVNGAVLAGLEPVFIPSCGLFPTAGEVLSFLERADRPPGAVLLTNPAYTGRSIRLAPVAAACRERNILLLVDEAHGPHFHFIETVPPTALEAGADIALHSMHKYMGSLVQTGLLHLGQGSVIGRAEMRSCLELFESTTRSNLLMVSIDEALRSAASPEGRRAFADTAMRCERLRQLAGEYGPVLRCEGGGPCGDPLKLMVSSDRAVGGTVGGLFLERGIDNEMTVDEGALFIFSPRNTEEDFAIFGRVMEDVHAALLAMEPEPVSTGGESMRANTPLMLLSPRRAFLHPRAREVRLGDARGMVNCSNRVSCPPGIPVLVPGEEITAWHIDVLPEDMLIRALDTGAADGPE